MFLVTTFLHINELSIYILFDKNMDFHIFFTRTFIRIGLWFSLTDNPGSVFRQQPVSLIGLASLSNFYLDISGTSNFKKYQGLVYSVKLVSISTTHSLLKSFLIFLASILISPTSKSILRWSRRVILSTYESAHGTWLYEVVLCFLHGRKRQGVHSRV